MPHVSGRRARARIARKVEAGIARRRAVGALSAAPIPCGAPIRRYRGHSVLNTLMRAHWAPVGSAAQRYVYAASACGGVFVYDAVTADLKAHLSQSDSVPCRDATWHPEIPLLVSGSFNGELVRRPLSRLPARLCSSKAGKRPRRHAASRLPHPSPTCPRRARACAVLLGRGE